MKNYLKVVVKMANKVIDANEFVDLLALKSDLIFANYRELYDYYKNCSDKEFITLIHTVNNILDLERGVFAILTDDITKKLYKLINIKRFDIKTTYPDEFEFINNIIIKLNSISNMREAQKKALREDYMKYQAEKRNLTYYDYQSFLESLGVDSIVIDYFQDEDTLDEVPYEYIIGSIFYLNDVLPSFFEMDGVQEKLSLFFKEIENSGYSKIPKKEINKVKQKVFTR